jgi:hypothetical protein
MPSLPLRMLPLVKNSPEVIEFVLASDGPTVFTLLGPISRPVAGS